MSPVQQPDGPRPPRGPVPSDGAAATEVPVSRGGPDTSKPDADGLHLGDLFSPATATWFARAFPAGPTAAQWEAWQAVGDGRDTLVLAPTGSGKTLAAFLWALDRMLIPDGTLPGGTPPVDRCPADQPPADGPSAGTYPANRLQAEPPPAGRDRAEPRCRVLYISPLKALAADVERNLRTPLHQITRTARELGTPTVPVRVAMRTGDTPQSERRALVRTPPDILITTPESLFLLLTSAARSVLRGVETVIVDEVHSLAGTKRGAHLAVSLERLNALIGRTPQRIGLSATVRPAADVAKWLVGSRRPAAHIVRPPSTVRIDVCVNVPLADMTALDTAEPPVPPRPLSPDGAAPSGAPATSGPPADPLQRAAPGPGPGGSRVPSIWPHLERRVYELITQNRSTLVFANSRRIAERFCARLNELHEQITGAPQQDAGAGQQDTGSGQRNNGAVPDDGPDQYAGSPAQVMGQAGQTTGAPSVLARVHHGSVSQAERARVERDLKEGRLRAVVATSSLELGIDMGSVDLVVQLGTPPSVASGLQRVGRAGHQVGVVSRGVLLPTFPAQVAVSAVVAERMRDGRIERLHGVRNPLDVLAQQIVAMVAMDPWPVEDLHRTLRGAEPFADLGPILLRSVLDLVSGRFPSEDFAHLRARIVWDRSEDLLTARPGAHRLAVTSGGTIPDRGTFGVYLIGSDPGDPSSAAAASPDEAATDAAATGVSDADAAHAGTTRTAAAPAGDVTDGGPPSGPAGHRGPRRVGELDEEMVHESRVGDVFTLGSTSWRIEKITPDRVLVSPAFGRPGRLPFWHGESPGRPAELGAALGAFLREVGQADPQAAGERARSTGLDANAVENLLALIERQRRATETIPDDRTLVLERYLDLHGDWRVVLHSPWGSPVHTPWAMVVAARLREQFSGRIQVTSADDGFALRLTDLDPDGGVLPMLAEQFALDPEPLDSLLTQELLGSALFASRFRECAARALLLPGNRPGRRSPLWQQRLRSARLLEIASAHPDFPITAEALRECLLDVFDVPRLRTVLRDLRARRSRIVEVTTPSPSPFAIALTQGEAAELVYERDAPLSERRAAALALDQGTLSELLGQTGPAPADLLDPGVVAEAEKVWQRLSPRTKACDVEQLVDLLGDLGPLDDAGVAARCEPADLAGPWLEELHGTGRILSVVVGGVGCWAKVEDAGRLRDALGTPVPAGVPEVFAEPVDDALGDLLLRYARFHGPFPAAWPADRLGLGVAVVEEVLGRLVREGRLVRGTLRPQEPGIHHCDPRVLRSLQRRSLVAARRRLEPVSAQQFGRFLPCWQNVGGDAHGVQGLADVVEQLAGVYVPASALETLVLPSRVRGYAPAMLDELTSTGRMLWSARGTPGGKDWWVCLHPADLAPVTSALQGIPLPAGTQAQSRPGQQEEERTPPFPGPRGARAVHCGQGAHCDQATRSDQAVREAVLAVLASGGGYFFDPLCRAVHDLLSQNEEQVQVPVQLISRTLWELVGQGLVTNDTLGPLRALLPTGRGPVRSRTTSRSRMVSGRSRRPRYGAGFPTGAPMSASALASPSALAGASASALPGASAGAGGPAGLRGAPAGLRGAPAGPLLSGRWSSLPAVEADPTLRAKILVELMVERHGVLTRGAVIGERLPGGFWAAYTVLSALEHVGSVRRGYLVEGLGPAQFAVPGAVDRLREDDRPGQPWPESCRKAVLLAAADPANPYGAALPWPACRTGADGTSGQRPGRFPDALVVLVDGALSLYVSRTGNLLTWHRNPQELHEAAEALAAAVKEGILEGLTARTADGRDLLDRTHPVGKALEAVGFRATPTGMRLRR